MPLVQRLQRQIKPFLQVQPLDSLIRQRKGFKSVKITRGSSIGFSPLQAVFASTWQPIVCQLKSDYINFTGMEYVGRDVHLVRSADAVITVGGRMGSLHGKRNGTRKP